MQPFIFTIAGILAAGVVLYFLPIGYSRRGKMILLLVASVLAAVGMLASQVYSFWTSALLLIALSFVTSLFVEKIMRSQAAPSDGIAEEASSEEMIQQDNGFEDAEPIEVDVGNTDTAGREVASLLQAEDVALSAGMANTDIHKEDRMAELDEDYEKFEQADPTLDTESDGLDQESTHAVDFQSETMAVDGNDHEIDSEMPEKEGLLDELEDLEEMAPDELQEIDIPEQPAASSLEDMQEELTESEENPSESVEEILEELTEPEESPSESVEEVLEELTEPEGSPSESVEEILEELAEPEGMPSEPVKDEDLEEWSNPEEASIESIVADLPESEEGVADPIGEELEEAPDDAVLEATLQEEDIHEEMGENSEAVDEVDETGEEPSRLPEHASMEAATTVEEEPERNQQIYQDVLHTMVAQIRVMQDLLAPEEYEQYVSMHMHPELGVQEYVTFAYLLVEHYIHTGEHEKLTALAEEIKARCGEYPIMVQEIDFMLEQIGSLN